MQKYEVMKQCEAQHDTAAQRCDDAAQAQALREESVAIAEAVHALRGLGGSEARKKLDAYHAFLDGEAHVFHIPHQHAPLNTFHPDWWVSSFTDLFFRGDFTEQPGMSLRTFSKTLLQRADFFGWKQSKEFAAAAYNICLRREQMWAVPLCHSRPRV